MDRPRGDVELAEIAARLHEPGPLDQTLETMVEVAVETLPDIDLVAAMVLGEGTVRTLASTGALAEELDRLQQDLGEGPCLDELVDGSTWTVAEHLRDGDARWPRFARAAVGEGVRAMLAVRVFEEPSGRGVLNLYSTSSDVIGDEARDIAQMFARHMALAYGRTRRIAHLERAITTRELIGQAVGILMERHQIGTAEAFEHLVRVSSAGELKLRDVAARLVSTVGSP